MSINCLNFIIINLNFRRTKTNSKMKKVIIIKTTTSDSELTKAFEHLTKDDLKRITTEEKIDRKRALKIAAVYGLETEVRICMDLLGMTPIGALSEWDLL